MAPAPSLRRTEKRSVPSKPGSLDFAIARAARKIARMSDGDSPTTEALEPAGRHTLVKQFRLAVTDGPDSGTTYLSKGDRTVIGTHESANLVLRDPTASRLHCEIVVEEGRALVRDLGSRNGTLVGGTRVLLAELANGQTLVLGRSQLRFELSGEHIKIPL